MDGIAINLPGGFSGLAPHVGALHGWYDAAQRGILPLPEYICTSSVGGIAGGIAVQNSEQVFTNAENQIIYLKRKHFASLNPELKKKAAITGLITLAGLLLPTHKIQSPYLRNALKLGLAGLVLSQQGKFIKDLFSVESFLTYDNLTNLLNETWNFDRIFNSPIKIEVPSVNINKAGWTLDDIMSDPPLYLHKWQNHGWSTVTNFKPEDVNLEVGARNQKFLEGVVNGMRLYGHFPPGRNKEGDALVDTATLSNVPLHFAIKAGYTKIVVLYYNRSTEGPSNNGFRRWTSSLNRSFDIKVAEDTRKVMLGYLRVNNDLGQLDKHRKENDLLEKFLSKQPTGTWPELEEALRLGREIEKSYSFSHKRQIQLLFVGSDPLPDIHFGHFSSDDMIDGINIGYNAFRNAIPQIEKMLSTNL